MVVQLATSVLVLLGLFALLLTWGPNTSEPGAGPYIAIITILTLPRIGKLLPETYQSFLLTAQGLHIPLHPPVREQEWVQQEQISCIQTQGLFHAVGALFFILHIAVWCAPSLIGDQSADTGAHADTGVPVLAVRAVGHVVCSRLCVWLPNQPTLLKRYGWLMSDMQAVLFFIVHYQSLTAEGGVYERFDRKDGLEISCAKTLVFLLGLHIAHLFVFSFSHYFAVVAVSVFVTAPLAVMPAQFLRLTHAATESVSSFECAWSYMLGIRQTRAAVGEDVHFALIGLRTYLYGIVVLHLCVVMYIKRSALVRSRTLFRRLSIVWCYSPQGGRPQSEELADPPPERLGRPHPGSRRMVDRRVDDAEGLSYY